MKKLIALMIALLIFAACAAAEALPASEPARPSRAWLGSVSAGLVDDLNVLSSDSDFIAALGLPDELAALISPVEAYETEPSLILYAPADTAAALSSLAGSAKLPAFAGENSDQLCLRMLNGMLYQYCSSEQLAMSSSIMLTQYCFQAPITPAVAFFIPADGAQGDPVMIQYSGRSGLVSISACYMPLFVYYELQNPASDLSAALAAADVDILRGGDISPEFPESAAISANIPVADETWLAQTAFEVARSMLDQCADPAYVRLFTADEVLIDICAAIGSVGLGSAQVGSITYYAASDLAYEFAYPSANQPLIEKYYAPKLGAFSTQMKLNSYGVYMVAAGSICAAGDVRAASGDFTSCVVILNTGCEYDVAVSFGMVAENIVAISAQPIPAE